MFYNISFKITKKGEVIEEGFDTINTPDIRHKISDFIIDMDFDDSNEVEIKINPLKFK